MPSMTIMQQQIYLQILRSLPLPSYIRFFDQETWLCNTALELFFNCSQLSKDSILSHLERDFSGFTPDHLPNRYLTGTRQSGQTFLLDEESIITEEGSLIGFLGQLKATATPTELQGELIERLSYERTISKISSYFVHLSDHIDVEINEALKDLALATKASRAYIFQFKDGELAMDNTHEWCAPGVEPQIDNLKDLPTEIFPWWMEKIKKNEIIHIESVKDMAPEASAEQEILESQMIQSVIVLPLVAQDQNLGFIGLDNIANSRRWKDDDLILLSLTAEIFSNVFMRKQYDNRLKDANLELSLTLDELRKLQAQMVHQEKMVGIGQLAAGIAHEINNPLGYVSSNFETLSKYITRLQLVLEKQKETIQNLDGFSVKGLDCDHLKESIATLGQLYKVNKIDYVLSDLTDLLEDSKSGFTRVADIINSLRNFARSESHAKHSSHNLLQIVDEVLLILGNEIRYVATVEKNIDPNLEITCNRSEIGQVIMNLVLNAIQAIKANEKLTTGMVRIQSQLTSNFVELLIEDDGIGVEADQLSQIFDPFYTTKEVGTGTGLGLSISYDIMVNKHEGMILVNSTPGKGTAFTLKFKIS